MLDPVKLGDDFKALWEQEGKDGSKVAKMMSMFNRTIGKEGITGWFNELLLRVASKKMVTPIYQTGLVGFCDCLDCRNGVQSRRFSLLRCLFFPVSKWIGYRYHGGI